MLQDTSLPVASANLQATDASGAHAHQTPPISPQEPLYEHTESAATPSPADRTSTAAAELPVNFGGAHGTGSSFTLSDDDMKKSMASESRYLELGQRILDKADIKINGDRPFDLVLHHPEVLRRVIKHGSLGLGEAFMEGWWDTRDFMALDEFFRRILQSGLEYYVPNNAKDAWNIIRAKLLNPQTKSRSRLVGLQHYDTGNDFFRSMLGPYMQYSCAYWQRTRPDGTVVPVATLAEAQQLKLRMIGEKLRLKEGMEVLDVGCGWGGLALYLHETFKVKVTGITISEEQRRSAAELVKDYPAITVLNMDYRDLSADTKFDRIVSVGMFEHVGPRNYKTFFKHMRRLLRDDDPEAVFLLHTIGSNETKLSADQWYLKYIFPGGCLPSVMNIGKAIEQHFVMEDWHNFGSFYGTTLLAWRENFLRHWPNSSERQKENAEVFFRTFFYYLSSSAGAFRARDLQLWQLVLSPHGIPGYPNVYRP